MDGMKLSESQVGVSYNLQLMRFLAALGVVFHHSFILSTGSMDREWLSAATGGQLTFGLVSVGLFFLAGGYLIAGSAQKSSSLFSFLKRRLMRLIPPLLAVNIVVIVVCCAFSSLPAARYFCHPDTWKYLLNSVFILRHDLPGVFTENVYARTVNGALWTMPVEFGCYVFCYLVKAVFGFRKKSYAITLPLAGVGIAVGVLLQKRIPFLSALLLPCIFFYLGMTIWVYKEYIHLNRFLFVAACAVMAIGCMLGVGKAALLIGMTYAVFYLSYGVRQIPKQWGVGGFWSYGIYLWAFPVQQMIIQGFGGQMNSYVNFAIAAPIACVGGALIYYLIEKKRG